MAETTSIEWCDATFNPWWGCTRISPACDHCYADTWARRTGHLLWDNGARRTFGDKHWNAPRKWAKTLPAKLGRRPRVFCASMADVFDKDAPDGARERLWSLIDETPELDWLLLTKRIGNAAKMRPEGFLRWPHVWLGSTIANQEEADRDIPKLLATPAHIRFLSCEPLLGPLTVFDLDGPIDLPAGMPSPLHWVIAGGESGPKARPSHPDWIRSLRDQCAGASVPFLFKQWGEWSPTGDSATVAVVGEGLHAYQLVRLGKKAAGRELDGRTYDAFPA